MRNIPGRRSRQNEQEQRSIHQFGERLVEAGWEHTRVQNDLGEDFIVLLYHRGEAVGVSFWVQLKSVSDARIRTTQKYLPHRFKIKDLKHWEHFFDPVILLVWDVNLRKGWWISARDAVIALDEENPNWRQNKKDAIVHVPIQNDTSVPGLDRLRLVIAQHYQPLFVRDGPMQINITSTFPPTPEGHEAARNLRRAFEEGERLELRGEYVTELDLPEWWSALYNPRNLPLTKLTLEPLQSNKEIRANLDILGKNGNAIHIPNMPLVVTRAGTKRMLLESNDRFKLLHFVLELRDAEDHVDAQSRIHMRFFGHGVSETMSLVELATIMMSGARVLLHFPDLDMKPLQTQMDPHPRMIDETFAQYVMSLYEIQNRTGVPITIPTTGPYLEDMALAERVLQIVRQGEVTLTDIREYALPGIDKEGLQRICSTYVDRDKVETFRIESVNYVVEISGTEISLGRFTRTIRGRLKEGPEVLKVLIEQMSDGSFVSLTIVDAAVVDEFPDWRSA